MNEERRRKPGDKDTCRKCGSKIRYAKAGSYDWAGLKPAYSWLAKGSVGIAVRCPAGGLHKPRD